MHQHRRFYQPVGSTVDKFQVHPNHGTGQDLQVNVPNPAPGEFGWTIDGYNGLVDLGTAQERNGDHFEASGKINPITVSDSRRSLAPWSISADVGNFKDGDKTFSGSYLGWSPYVLDQGAGCHQRRIGGLRLRRQRPGPVRLARPRSRRPGPRPWWGQARRRPGSEDPGQRYQGWLPRHSDDHRTEQLINPSQQGGHLPVPRPA